MAAKFLRYSLPILVLFDLLAAVGIVTVVSWLAKQVKGGSCRRSRCADSLHGGGARIVRGAGAGVAVLLDASHDTGALARR
jgi:hypothetical protein